MVLKQYIVDSFTDKVFLGNPAAVCVLEEEIPEKLLVNIASENGLSETAFAIKKDGRYNLRWLTPGGEIDLCGHATLATAFVLTKFYNEKDEIFFDTLSGGLVVRRNRDVYEMEFPAYPMKQIPVTDEMEAAIGVRPVQAWIARDLVCVLRSEEDVVECTPDYYRALNLPGLLLHTTAQGMQSDYVIRSFAPKLGVMEDPVCGSGHCHTAPVWAEKLGHTSFKAYQASRRGGKIDCRLVDKKIYLSGKAVLYSEAEIHI